MIQLLRSSAILLIFSFALVSCLETDDPRPDEVFIKFFGEDGVHNVTDMLLNSEGQVVIFGTQQINTSDARQTFYILRTDSLGNRIEDPTVIDPGNENILNATTAVESQVIEEIEDGYLIAGNTRFLAGSNLGDNFIFWARLNDELQLQSWDTISALVNEGVYPEVSMFVRDLIVTSDNNVVISGSTFYPQPNDPFEGGQSQNLLVKKSLDGETTIWQRSDGRPSFADQIVRIHELPGGNIAAVGATDRAGSQGEGGINVSYQIYNAQGLSQVGQSVRVGMTIDGNNSANDIPFNIVGSDAGAKVVGTSVLGGIQRGFVIVFQGTSIVQTLIEPEDPNQNIALRGITTTRSGDLMLAGSNLNVQNGDIYVIRGNQLGARRDDYPENTMGVASGSDVAKTALTLPNGSILIASDVDFGSGQVMIGLVRLNDRVELQKQ